MSFLKHVGRLVPSNRKCIVAYRVVPNDPDSCLVVQTENLSADEHDTLIRLVESNTGQSSYELGEAMARQTLPDGSVMLARFHQTNRLMKVSTSSVQMTPTTNDSIMLNELNEQMAQQKGVTVADLALSDGTTSQSENTVVPENNIVEDVIETDNQVLSDEQLAAQYRSQADALFKEAKALREQAESLSPTKKKVVKEK